MDRRRRLHNGWRLHHRSPAQSWHISLEPNIPPEVLEISGATALMARDPTTTSSSTAATTKCAPNDTSSFCQKPVNSSTFTLPIILGVAIPLVGAAIVFTYLHRRHVRKQRQEDANDPHKSLDFGLGNVGKKGGTASPDMADISLAEKPGRRGRQVSMDIISPYLLPIELQNSRESLHSLSRTLQQDDPYQPIQGFIVSDSSSMRSFNRPRGDGSSVYTGSSVTPSRIQDGATADLLGNAAGMPRSVAPSTLPLRQASLPQSGSFSPVNNQGPHRLPEMAGDTSPINNAHIQFPAPVAQPIQRKEVPNELPSGPRSGINGSISSGSSPIGDRALSANNGGQDLRNSNDFWGTVQKTREPSPPPQPPVRSPERAETQAMDFMTQEMSRESLPASPRPKRKEFLPVNQASQFPPQPQPQAAVIEDGSDYGDEFQVTPPSPNLDEQMRGQRYSMDVPPEEFAQAGLGVPGFDPRRLSMNFRPLPPNAIVESDDPEVRANRIRSFYKEYFDDSKPAPQGQYYEDYDENYLGETTFFDPNSNSFVMPYAQPVTRRAMTPPPQAQRFMGQPPRAFHGSMGDLRASRAPGPRAYSSASGRMPPPNRMGTPSRTGSPGLRRPAPPPAALNSLPIPSKLRDDSFALMNSVEFAPPVSYRDRQAGRSESPLGERRPYSPSVPAFKPLTSPYEELAPMPSPHLLRKSGTFTGLDFAPPRRIKDPDTMSDAGSIRSNQSGLSNVQANAIRNGAYRVSRLPVDTVFTRDDISSILKPTWNMRQGS